MIGDCIHNTRSALDHFYWALVLLTHPNGDPADDQKATFPIYRSASTFTQKKKQIEKFVGRHAAAILERLQPYQGGRPDEDALLFIHKSDITDKHRLLVPSVGLVERGQVRTTTRNGFPSPYINRRVVFQDRLHDGATMVTVTVTPPSSAMDVNLENARVGIVFQRADGGVVRVPKALASFIEAAEGVPDEFPGFF